MEEGIKYSKEKERKAYEIGNQQRRWRETDIEQKLEQRWVKEENGVKSSSVIENKIKNSCKGKKISKWESVDQNKGGIQMIYYVQMRDNEKVNEKLAVLNQKKKKGFEIKRKRLGYIYKSDTDNMRTT